MEHVRLYQELYKKHFLVSETNITLCQNDRIIWIRKETSNEMGWR